MCDPALGLAFCSGVTRHAVTQARWSSWNGAVEGRGDGRGSAVVSGGGETTWDLT